MGAPRLAICVAGALRTFIEPEVASAFWQAIGRTEYDVFFHVFVGEELSARGQEETSDLLSTALALRNASVNATQVRVQFRENRFLCGQMTTGRFFKMASCARAVLAHAERNNLTYDLFVATRPDLLLKNRFPPTCLRNDDGTVRNASYAVSGEVIVAPFSSVAQTFATLDDPKQMQCCNRTDRTPPQCFWDGLADPDPNYLLMRHLESNGLQRLLRHDAARSCHWNTAIKRESHKALNLMKLAGQYRSHIEQREAPVSASLDDFIYLLRMGARSANHLLPTKEEPQDASACWVPAPRPPRWATCYDWFNESWSHHAVVGDFFFKYAPSAYAELCPLDREPYRQSTCGDPLPGIDESLATNMLERLAGSTVLFNGDSISVEHWMATACALLPGAHTWSTRVSISSLASKSRRTTQAMCVSLGREGQNATRLCYSRLESAALRLACDNLGPADVVVANWGVQYHTHTGKASVYLTNVTAETIRALTARPRWVRPLIIWRETAPQHFPADTGNYGGDRLWWTTQHANCMPIQRLDLSFNEVVNPMLRQARIPILPVWEPSLPHYNAHFSWKPLGDRRVLDCTHYCLATGLLDHWVELLFARINLEDG